ncbi:MAG: Hsp20 family protein [candidate division WOR-3 bacterium]|nr:MAG: Hsp20 family protein [candidate division WOR-3 bacterium]
MTSKMLASFDKYLPTTLGFDHLFNALDHAADFINTNTQAFPPVNVIKEGENVYYLEMAVAGYGEDEIEVLTEKNTLKIIGKKVEEKSALDQAVDGEPVRQYIVKGIAGRSFVRSFVMSDTVHVIEAGLKDGILTIKLENVIPEEKQPRKIPLVKWEPAKISKAAKK